MMMMMRNDGCFLFLRFCCCQPKVDCDWLKSYGTQLGSTHRGIQRKARGKMLDTYAAMSVYATRIDGIGYQDFYFARVTMRANLQTVADR